MRKTIFTLVLLVGTILMLSSCTENQRARSWGGTATYDLPQGEKLEMVTWKDSDLWILTRERKDGEAIDTYNFFEKSSWGLLEGNYVIKEH